MEVTRELLDRVGNTLGRFLLLAPPTVKRLAIPGPVRTGEHVPRAPRVSAVIEEFAEGAEGTAEIPVSGSYMVVVYAFPYVPGAEPG
jgi:hypothetical protein